MQRKCKTTQCFQGLGISWIHPIFWSFKFHTLRYRAVRPVHQPSSHWNLSEAKLSLFRVFVCVPFFFTKISCFSFHNFLNQSIHRILEILSSKEIEIDSLYIPKAHRFSSNSSGNCLIGPAPWDHGRYGSDWCQGWLLFYIGHPVWVLYPSHFLVVALGPKLMPVLWACKNGVNDGKLICTNSMQKELLKGT